MVYWGTTNAPEHASDSPEYLVARSYFEMAAKLPRVGPEGKLSRLAEDIEMEGVQLAKAENRLRDNEDKRIAMLLGYNSWWNATIDAPKGTPGEVRRQDMLDELEEDRYFIILMVYDFQIIWRQNKHKLLWETRFSINEHHNQFDKTLPVVAQYASRYFGQGSNGLLRTRVSEGRVEIGEPRSLGEIPDK